MSIISFSGSASFTTSVEDIDVKLLEKQIENLQQQILDENLSGEERDKKQAAIQELQAQIQIIQMKLQQMESQRNKEEFMQKQNEDTELVKSPNKIDFSV